MKAKEVYIVSEMHLPSATVPSRNRAFYSRKKAERALRSMVQDCIEAECEGWDISHIIDTLVDSVLNDGKSHFHTLESGERMVVWSIVTLPIEG